MKRGDGLTQKHSIKHLYQLEMTLTHDEHPLSPKPDVAERISNYCLAQELFSPLWSRSHIFDQWECFIPFCSDDFPGQYKRRCKHSFSLSLSLSLSLPRTFFEQDRSIISSSHIFRTGYIDPLFLTPAADHHQHEESTSNLWTVVF